VDPLPTVRGGGQDEVAVTKPLSTSPLLTTNGVDKMYDQLIKIHAIITAQLAECAHWCRSGSTPSLVWVGTY
jgi:hypothetical protein